MTRRDSAVVFIGEDESPVFKKEKISNSKRSKLSHSFPSTFLSYLISENSVIMRLTVSLLPPFGKFNRIPIDPEGSFLSLALLSLTLYWGFVSNTYYSKDVTPRLYWFFHSVALTFGYVTVSSLIVWCLCCCSKTFITLRQIISILSYGLFGHTLTLLLVELISDQWFVPLMFIIGGLDALRICLILMARTPVPGFQFLLCVPVSIMHISFLIYLHFAIMRKS